MRILYLVCYIFYNRYRYRNSIRNSQKEALLNSYNDKDNYTINVSATNNSTNNANRSLNMNILTDRGRGTGSGNDERVRVKEDILACDEIIEYGKKIKWLHFLKESENAIEKVKLVKKNILHNDYEIKVFNMKNGGMVNDWELDFFGIHLFD